jgi:hypothetical protein
MREVPIRTRIIGGYSINGTMHQQVVMELLCAWEGIIPYFQRRRNAM